MFSTRTRMSLMVCRITSASSLLGLESDGVSWLIRKSDHINQISTASLLQQLNDEKDWSICDSSGNGHGNNIDSIDYKSLLLLVPLRPNSSVSDLEMPPSGVSSYLKVGACYGEDFFCWTIHPKAWEGAFWSIISSILSKASTCSSVVATMEGLLNGTTQTWDITLYYNG